VLGEKAQERKCKKPAVQPTTEEKDSLLSLLFEGLERSKYKLPDAILMLSMAHIW